MDDKPRFIRSIRQTGGLVLAQVKDGTDLRDVNVSDLTRPELVRAAALLGIKSNGGWSSWTNDNLVGAIEDTVLSGREHKPRGTGVTNGDAKNGDAEGKNESGGTGEADGESGDDEANGEAGDGEADGDGDGEADGESGDDEKQGDSPANDLTPEEQQKLLDDATPLEERIQIMVKQAAAKQQREEEEAEAKRKKEEAENQPDPPKGSHPALADVLAALEAGQHVYLVGPPGTGKSYITQQAAEILNLTYGAMSCGPQTPESRLWGYCDANGNYVDTEFRRRYENGGVFTLDEADNGNSGILTSLNQALAGSGANFPDAWVDMHDTTRICATANTWGTGATAQFMGRAPQDFAFLDRFTFIEVEIDHKVERFMVESTGLKGKDATEWLRVVRKIRKNAEAAKLNIVVSPRASKAGAELILKGWDTEKVLKARVFKGLTSDKVARLMEGV
jgi:MoxR-like ATPase